MCRPNFQIELRICGLMRCRSAPSRTSISYPSTSILRRSIFVRSHRNWSRRAGYLDLRPRESRSGFSLPIRFPDSPSRDKRRVAPSSIVSIRLCTVPILEPVGRYVLLQHCGRVWIGLEGDNPALWISMLEEQSRHPDAGAAIKYHRRVGFGGEVVLTLKENLPENDSKRCPAQFSDRKAKEFVLSLRDSRARSKLARSARLYFSGEIPCKIVDESQELGCRCRWRGAIGQK